MAALNTRRDSLKAALTIANNDDRMVAMKAAWTVYMKASLDARIKFRADVQAAQKAFVIASADCHIDSDYGPRRHPKDDDKDGDKDGDHENSGRHLGWFKNLLKHDVKTNAKANANINGKTNANAHANFDLSF